MEITNALIEAYRTQARRNIAHVSSEDVKFDIMRCRGFLEGYAAGIAFSESEHTELLKYKIVLADVLMKLHDIVYWIPENSKDFTRHELKQIIAKMETF